MLMPVHPGVFARAKGTKEE